MVLFLDGVGLRLGDKEADCWYLYTLNGATASCIDSDNMRFDEKNCLNTDPDQTIEILMTDLDPQVMSVFTKECSASALQATQVSPLF